jgi:uncharacterized protein (DUF1330 family)
MPKAYAVVVYRSISDPQKLAAYGKIAIPAVTSFGGRILARGTAAVTFEHGLKERVPLPNFQAWRRQSKPLAAQLTAKRSRHWVIALCATFGLLKA